MATLKIFQTLVVQGILLNECDPEAWSHALQNTVANPSPKIVVGY